MLPNHPLKTTAALALTLAAVTPTAASARPYLNDPTLGTSQTTTPIVRVVTPNSGFDWGDAAIGGAGGLALSLLGLGGALALSHQRSRRPNSPTPIR